MPAISENRFSARMKPLGPFEAAPILAVAVSGGADSMALCLLAQTWVKRRGGAIIALTVDHGLRKDSKKEAQQVSSWLMEHGIQHQILRWTGKKPSSGIQDAARQARYELLENWCQTHNVLHLLVAHHSGDQAETLLLRLQKDSGIIGLAGMPFARALPGVRLLRPLLQENRVDLISSLVKKKQPWLEDPSNDDLRFARVQVRKTLIKNEVSTNSVSPLMQIATQAAIARRQLHSALADLAAKTVRLHPAGYCIFNPSLCLGQNKPLLAPLLADILRCIGGGIYRPRRAHVERLCNIISNKRIEHGRTLAGARIIPNSRGLLVCREVGRLHHYEKVRKKKQGRWDRFNWWVTGEPLRGMSVGPLGQEGWRQIREQSSNIFPSLIYPSLPVLWYDGRVIAAPHVNFSSSSINATYSTTLEFRVMFSPAHSLQPDAKMLV